MKIICIGRNYASHAKELNNPIPEEPVIFMKPDSSLIRNNQPFFIPDFSTDVHHEVELVVKINKLGKHIEKKFAHKYYHEIGIGIDFTARDLQSKMKEKGLPWEKAKGFDGSAPLGKFVPKSTFSDIENINFHLDINGKRVQTGNTSNMLFSIDTIVEHVSKYFTLKIGDLIYTGTPEGVGPVKAGDRLACFIEEEELLAFNIR
ncbi:MAG TPA: fumarylacetoacetate hydrolase family protein [Flavobacteriales bacterium]|nr:fumarylacetoacetate hydrolase family protein [Flavobacteriales bacterium]HIO68550.1 fumarylacetoacetate hydrolase family protein [Flavobacteriales bacterium]